LNPGLFVWFLMSSLGLVIGLQTGLGVKPLILSGL